jgi:mRNA interferase MazF
MGPNRGEVWLVDLGYVGKTRPCLVLSIKPLDTDRALVTLVPHTTTPRGTRFEIDLNLANLKSGVFDAQNPVTVSPAKLIRRLGSLAADEMTKVEDAVRMWLGL